MHFSDTKKKASGTYLFLLIFTAYAVSYIGRKGFSACMTEIGLTYSVDKTFLGMISTGFLISYGGGQLINGILGDHLSPRPMIAVGLIGAGICNLLMGLCPSRSLLLPVWCLNGFFNSMLWSPVIRAIAQWLPEDRQISYATAISVSLPTGSIVSYCICSLCLHFGSWRISFLLSGTVILLFAVVWLKGTVHHPVDNPVLKENIPADSLTAETKSTSGPQTRVSIMYCLVSSGILMAAVGILFNGMIKDGVTEWTPSFLTGYFSVSPDTASLMTSLLPIVNLGGAYAASFILKKVRNEMAVSAILFGLCTIFLLLLRLAGQMSVILSVLLIALSTCSMLGVNNMFLTFMPLHFASAGRSASITGILDAFSYLAAAGSAALIGFLAENYGWNATMVSWILAALFGLLICLSGIRIWENGKRKIEHYREKKD